MASIPNYIHQSLKSLDPRLKCEQNNRTGAIRFFTTSRETKRKVVLQEFQGRAPTERDLETLRFSGHPDCLKTELRREENERASDTRHIERESDNMAYEVVQDMKIMARDGKAGKRPPRDPTRCGRTLVMAFNNYGKRTY